MECCVVLWNCQSSCPSCWVRHQDSGELITLITYHELVDTPNIMGQGNLSMTLKVWARGFNNLKGRFMFNRHILAISYKSMVVAMDYVV
jgi:hypothetical protein